MGIESLIVLLLVGAVAGWLAGMIMKSGSGGLLTNIIVGIVGAFIGGWLLPVLGMNMSGIVGSIVSATIGAVVLLFILGLIKK